MIIEIPYKHSSISIDTSMKGRLDITLPDNKEVLEAIVESVLGNYTLEDIASCICDNQLKELVEIYNKRVEDV